MKTVSIGDIAEVFIPSKYAEESGLETRVITHKSLRQDMSVNLSIGEVKHFQNVGNALLQQEDILLTSAKGYLEIGIVSEITSFCIAASPMVTIRCDQAKMEPCLLAHYLKLPNIHHKFMHECVKGSMFPHPVPSQIRMFQVPVIGEINEQRNISKMISNMHMLISKYHDQIKLMTELIESTIHHAMVKGEKITK